MRNPASYGTAVGEPPVLADPRRWGALIGIVGGLVFIFSYSAPLGTVVSIVAKIAGIVLALFGLIGYYVRPSSLGALRAPGRRALVVYLSCVAAELAVIAVGSKLLTSADHGELRPALIAAVVGLHFIPFGWAFGERRFYTLGVALLVLGGIGMIAGYAGLTHAADAAAVVAGLVMLALIAWGARSRHEHHR